MVRGVMLLGKEILKVGVQPNGKRGRKKRLEKGLRTSNGGNKSVYHR